MPPSSVIGNPRRVAIIGKTMEWVCTKRYEPELDSRRKTFVEEPNLVMVECR